MKILVALIYLSGPGGAVEYLCNGNSYYIYAQDRLGVNVRGSTVDVIHTPFKLSFINKVADGNPHIVHKETCDGKNGRS